MNTNSFIDELNLSTIQAGIALPDDMKSNGLSIISRVEEEMRGGGEVKTTDLEFLKQGITCLLNYSKVKEDVSFNKILNKATHYMEAVKIIHEIVQNSINSELLYNTDEEKYIEAIEHFMSAGMFEIAKNIIKRWTTYKSTIRIILFMIDKYCK